MDKRRYWPKAKPTGFAFDDEHLKKIASRILDQAASKERMHGGQEVWWGHDTDLGTDDELMATCLEILKEELGMKVSSKIVGISYEEWQRRLDVVFKPVTTLEV